jgi:hypothetical protein
MREAYKTSRHYAIRTARCACGFAAWRRQHMDFEAPRCPILYKHIHRVVAREKDLVIRRVYQRRELSTERYFRPATYQVDLASFFQPPVSISGNVGTDVQLQAAPNILSLDDDVANSRTWREWNRFPTAGLTRR